MSDDTTDSLTRRGAEFLASRLRNYWREQGSSTISVWIEPAGPAAHPRASVWVVRSNLVNGNPPPEPRRYPPAAPWRHQHAP